jgi:hypothetical protein
MAFFIVTPVKPQTYTYGILWNRPQPCTSIPPISIILTPLQYVLFLNDINCDRNNVNPPLCLPSQISCFSSSHVITRLNGKWDTRQYDVIISKHPCQAVGRSWRPLLAFDLCQYSEIWNIPNCVGCNRSNVWYVQQCWVGSPRWTGTLSTRHPNSVSFRNYTPISPRNATVWASPIIDNKEQIQWETSLGDAGICDPPCVFMA